MNPSFPKKTKDAAAVEFDLVCVLTIIVTLGRQF